MGHLSALLRKNLLLWKRNKCCAVMEIMFPVAFLCLVFLIRSLVKSKDIAEQIFLQPNIEDGQYMPAKIASNFPEQFKNLEPHLQRTPLGAAMKNCINNEIDDSLQLNGHVVLAPKNYITEELEQLFKNFGYESKYYNNLDEIEKIIEGDNYDLNMCLGITVEKADEQNNHWKYRIHFNDTEEEIPHPLASQYNTHDNEDIDYNIHTWIDNGFMTIQNWVDNIILRHEMNNDDININPYITSQRVAKYKEDKFYNQLAGDFATYTLLPLVIIYLRFLYQILLEKQDKIREMMQIMGMSSTSFYFSWIIHYGIVYFVIVLISSVILSLVALPNSSFTLIFFTYLLYALNCMFQALTISTFFSKANVGMIAGLVLYFGSYIVTNVVASNQNMAVNTKTILCILPQVAFALAGKTLAKIENKQEGLDWSKLDLEVDKFTLDKSIYMMLLSLAIFIILFLYFDQVFPNEFGVKKHPLFCLQGLRKKKNSIEQVSRSERDENEQNDDFKQKNVEEVEGVLKDKEKHGEAIVLQNLCKIYDNGKKAVDNLNLKMYKDHISCFLGHNGAGKTTTISMLTGMLDITKGAAKAFGYDVKTQMPELRKIMGVCPQHDILFGNLTCEEHLELFAVFKGMKDKLEIKKQVDQMLADVDLTFKRNDLSKNLSGGQKRRLSVAMAFIGGSKLIYLDEPTSGCDTSVRRAMWDMLRRYKQDKIIVLTTHFMDEADYLGDRISIVGGGKLLCSGSSNYLKNKFGVGYNLTIVKNNTTIQSDPIIKTVMKHIGTAKKVSDVSSELSFQLKMSEIDKFQALFDELDAQKQTLQIANYGISITTMEEVFLKVGHMTQDDMNQADSFVRQNSRQNSRIMANESEVKQKDANLDNFDLNEVRIKDPLSLFFCHFWALILKRLRFFKRDGKGIFCELVMPSILTVLGLWSLKLDLNGTGKPYLLEPDLYSQKQPVLYGGAAGIPQTEMQKYVSGFSNDYQFAYSDKTVLEEFDKHNFDLRKEERRGAYYFETISPNSYEYLIEIASLNKDATPLYMNQMNQAILRNALNDQNAKLETMVSPWPETKDVKSSNESEKGILASFTFGMLLAFIPTSLIAFILMERENQVKHQQLVSGVSLKAYWLSNYFLDLMKFLFPYCVFALSMFWAFNLKTYTDKGEVFFSVVIMFVLYGASIIPWTYATSFLFQQSGNAQVMTFFVNFLMGSIIPMILFILRTFVTKAKPYALAFSWLFRLIPSFCFGNSMLNIASRQFFVLIYDDVDKIQSPYDIEIAGGDMIIMCALIPLSFGAIYAFEYMKSRGTIDKLLAKQSGCPQYQPKLHDDDVQKERDIVHSRSERDYVIKLDEIRKVFKKADSYFEAVDNVSVGIDKGECFTLLGVNGAGKTTLFKILTGDHISTEGNAYINGYNVSTEMEKARYNIGYCPQFDALLGNLTTREHLELYSAIKGIPQEMRKELIDKKIVEMDLQNFENVCAGTYSGGNKRKLSVAVAMIGNPPVVLLDEPSTGMDPKARRFMWNVISRISTENKSSSIVLTTHSMEEAEALSTKMVIMVAGNFKCLGSIQHIKSKFGQGYEVEVKINLPTEEKLLNQISHGQLPLEFILNKGNYKQILEKLGFSQYENSLAIGKSGEQVYKQIISEKGLNLKNLAEFIYLENQSQQVMQFIGNTFGDYELIEHFNSFSRYKILTDYPIGQMFGQFQKNKQQLDIASYSVKQSTIEAIFNNFAEGNIKTEDFNKGGRYYKDFQKNCKPLKIQKDQEQLQIKEQEIKNQDKNQIDVEKVVLK